MEFRILGPLCADAGTGSGPAIISQPLLQSALAVLLLRANRPCPRSMLIEALWGAEPPASPDAALRVCVSRLRRCLGDCATRLDSVGPPGGRAPGHRQQRGYMMTVRPGELDVDEFTDLVAQGQAELDTGNAPAAAASFVQALALWGDPPLPDLPDSEVIAAAVARLRNQRQTAVDALFDARLAAGEYEQVLGQLRAAVSAAPGRERTCAQLMRAYHALGMHIEALDVYQQAREVTLEQQGAEPGPVLAVLYQRILADELTTDRPAQVSKLGAGGLTMLGSQAPAPPADFTGRSDEIAHAVEYLSGSGVPVVVITGGPGMGKSATAAVVALQLRHRFTDGQIYAELGGVEHPRDPHDVLADILQSVGIPASTIPLAGPARAAMYRSVLADRKILVIADDAAHAAQVRPLIPAPAGAAVLVTSRSPLNGLVGARHVSVGELARDDALTLLTVAARPGRVAAEPAAAADVVTTCAGMPLAIRIAGTLLAARPGLSLTGLAREHGSGRVLDVLAAEDNSVRAAIESSYRALAGAAQAVLSLAGSQVAGDIPAWALTALGGGDASVADKLVSVGLLRPAEVAVSGQRYNMHPLVRAYACERAGDHAKTAQSAVQRQPGGPGKRHMVNRPPGAIGPQPDAPRRQPDAPRRQPDAVRGEPHAVTRLRAGWLDLAHKAAIRLPAMPFVVRPAPLVPVSAASATSGIEAEQAWLDCERANLLTTVDHAAAAGDTAAAVALASRLIGHQCLTGAFADATRAWRTVAAACAGDAGRRAIADYYLAVTLAESHERVTEAATLLAGALPELERAGEQDIAAMGYALQARCASASCRHAAAIRAARHAIRLTGPDGDLVRCCATAVFGLTLARVGITKAGIEQCRQARSHAQQLQEPAYEAYATRAPAQALMVSGHYTASASACGDGIELARQLGSDVTAARFVLLLGRARQCSGDLAAAAASLHEAAEAFRTAHLRLEEVMARSMLAACRAADGDRLAAAAQVGEVTRILQRGGVADADTRSAAAVDACLPARQLLAADAPRLIAG